MKSEEILVSGKVMGYFVLAVAAFMVIALLLYFFAESTDYAQDFSNGICESEGVLPNDLWTFCHDTSRIPGYIDSRMRDNHCLSALENLVDSQTSELKEVSAKAENALRNYELNETLLYARAKDPHNDYSQPDFLDDMRVYAADVSAARENRFDTYAQILGSSTCPLSKHDYHANYLPAKTISDLHQEWASESPTP